MLVEDVMTKDVVTVGPDDTLGELRKLFDWHRFHHVLVVRQGKLEGVISDRDVLREMSPFVEKLSERPQDRETLQRRAHQIMSRKLVVIGRHEPLAAALERLLDHGVSCLPVVTSGGHVEGILTVRDLLRAAAHRPRG